jgi:aminodeoxychorismate lyase
LTTLSVFLNGAIIPKHQALISVDDRGFRFGDGVFETLPVIQGAPYLWEQHLARLQEGLEALRIEVDISAFIEPFLTLIAHNHIGDGVGRILVTRGIGSKGYLPTGNAATIYMEIVPDIPLIVNDTLPAPLQLWRSEWRRFAPSVLPSSVKLMQGVNATLARMEAQAHQCDEALLLSTEGHIAEAASGNLFWCKDDTLYTPSLSTGCVAGTMRARLMQISEMPVQEVQASLAELSGASAMMMTNALQGIVPVGSILNESLFFPASEALANRCRKWVQEDIVENIAAFQQKMIAAGLRFI